VALIKPHNKGWHLNFWESFYIQAYPQSRVLTDEQSAYDHQLFTIKQDTPHNRAHELGMPKDTTYIYGHKRTSSRLIPAQYITSRHKGYVFLIILLLREDCGQIMILNNKVNIFTEQDPSRISTYSHYVYRYLEEMLRFKIWYCGTATNVLVAIFMNKMLQKLHKKY
jgi:hypothetical protein